MTSVATLGVTINDYIKILTKFFAFGISGNDLTVTRGELGTTAAAQTDSQTVTKLTVTASKTTINETTSSGVTAPLIKNLEEYESGVESGSNSWKSVHVTLVSTVTPPCCDD